MKYGYFPGCTLKKDALSFEASALMVMKALEVDVEEMTAWNCCGTSFGLSKDLLIHQIGPMRNILRAREQGFDALVTLCSICYNTLKRADQFVSTDPIVRRRITSFLDEYPPYEGGFPVYHLLEILEDQLGYPHLREKISRPLGGLKAAPYSGCMLVRPKDLGFDAMERPRRLSRFLEACGAEAIDFPMTTECCGAYHIVDEPDTAAEFSRRIHDSARERGASCLVTSCPMCHHNLDRGQQRAKEQTSGFEPLPVIYFTQVLAYALGAELDDLGLGEQLMDPRPILAQSNVATTGGQS